MCHIWPAEVYNLQSPFFSIFSYKYNNETYPTWVKKKKTQSKNPPAVDDRELLILCALLGRSIRRKPLIYKNTNPLIGS